MPSASCRDVTRVYRSASGPVRALKGVDVAVEPGQVTAIIGPSGSGGLQSLLAKSLVQQHEQPDGEPRFTMLETIRQYALEKAVMAGEVVDHQRVHAAYFLHLAETVEPALRGSQ